jgi:hypothetical protein
MNTAGAHESSGKTADAPSKPKVRRAPIEYRGSASAGERECGVRDKARAHTSLAITERFHRIWTRYHRRTSDQSHPNAAAGQMPNEVMHVALKPTAPMHGKYRPGKQQDVKVSGV